jgi:hypothetical protein
MRTNESDRELQHEVEADFEDGCSIDDSSPTMPATPRALLAAGAGPDTVRRYCS